MYTEIEGNLITLALAGEFEVIAHGCNCFCRQKRGLAPQMVEAFETDKFLWEKRKYEGNINKLGNIDFEGKFLSDGKAYPLLVGMEPQLIVVNCYTQYQWSTETKPFDYEAFTLCMRKMNFVFKGKHIGLPQIGSHLAGGSWDLIKPIIQKELKDCSVTVVIFKA